MDGDITFDELAESTKRWIAAHPFDPDAHARYIMSHDWRPRDPFIYEDANPQGKVIG